MPIALMVISEQLYRPSDRRVEMYAGRAPVLWNCLCCVNQQQKLGLLQIISRLALSQPAAYVLCNIFIGWLFGWVRFVRSHNSETTLPDHRFCVCCLWPWFGHFLAASRCVNLLPVLLITSFFLLSGPRDASCTFIGYDGVTVETTLHLFQPNFAHR